LLRNVIENYLRSVPETEFHPVLQFLLESLGYDEIHITHGIVEFGKDLIAKKDTSQYAFVVKAKDVGTATLDVYAGCDRFRKPVQLE
jgi:hypothetical protein